MNDLLLKEVAATEDLIIVLERAAQAWAEQNDRLQKEVVGGGGGGRSNGPTGEESKSSHQSCPHGEEQLVGPIQAVDQ